MACRGQMEHIDNMQKYLSISGAIDFVKKCKVLWTLKWYTFYKYKSVHKGVHGLELRSILLKVHFNIGYCGEVLDVKV